MDVANLAPHLNTIAGRIKNSPAMQEMIQNYYFENASRYGGVPQHKEEIYIEEIDIDLHAYQRSITGGSYMEVKVAAHWPQRNRDLGNSVFSFKVSTVSDQISDICGDDIFADLYNEDGDEQ